MRKLGFGADGVRRGYHQNSEWLKVQKHVIRCYVTGQIGDKAVGNLMGLEMTFRPQPNKYYPCKDTERQMGKIEPMIAMEPLSNSFIPKNDARSCTQPFN